MLLHFPLWRLPVCVVLLVLEGRLKTSAGTPKRAPCRWLLFSALLQRLWSAATGADKELVDGKTRVRDLVIESLTLCHSAWGGVDWKKHYRELSRVRLWCSWEHRYDNGTDPFSLWLITSANPLFCVVARRCPIWMHLVHEKCIYIGEPD